jgi:trehalose 6-phosphate phosphatase
LHDSYPLRQLFEAIATQRPSGILTDIDGTISHIAPSPDAATVEVRARRALRRLSGILELVAAVSGRAAEDARAMVEVDELVYSGNHGMEWWVDGTLQQSDLATEHVPRVAELLDRAQRELDIEGLLFENKGLTASIHVRETCDPETAEQRVLERVEEHASDLGLRITRGRMVIEIRPPIDLDKGSAVLDLVHRFGLRAGIYYGDDVTDVDAFKALRAVREEGAGQFFAVGVTGPETPSVVLENADATVDGVNGVIESLEQLADLLESPQP